MVSDCSEDSVDSVSSVFSDTTSGFDSTTSGFSEIVSFCSEDSDGFSSVF